MSAALTAAAPAPEAPQGAAPPPATAAPPGTAPPPGALASPGAPPGDGGSPPPAPFADLLNAHVARTATAEGQTKTATDNGGHAKTDTSQDSTAVALAAAVAGIAVPVAPVQAPTAKPAAPAQEETPAPAAPAQEAPVQEALLDSVAAQASSSAAGATTVAQATASAAPSTPAPAQPAATPQPTTTPQPQQTVTPQSDAPQPQTARPENRVSTLLSALSGSVHVTRTPAAVPAKPPAPDLTPTTTAAAPTDTDDAAHTGTASQGDSDHDDAQQPTTSSLPSAAVTTAAAPGASSTATARFELPRATEPVTLPHAAQAMQETIALATRQGATEARIQLAPESLGPINIHLQHTADGVVARVVAGPEAAQHFQQGADDLRRSLQDSGVNLIGLQIETSSGRDTGSQAQAQADAQAQPTRHQNAGTPETLDPAPSITRLEPLHGASISVLA